LHPHSCNALKLLIFKLLFEMATKIRLQRFGRKSYAYYHIVVADVRAPRDGRFIERIGSYNPNTNPATVNLDFEAALKWVNCGAQPTDTVRNILSSEGVMLMKHLQGGVKKGAFTEEVAKQKFEAWKAGKEKANDQVVAKLAASKEASAKERLEAEKAANKAKAAQIAAKKAELLAAQEAAAAEAAAEEAPAEAAAE
jgi:small subunit ribosomal protein S16